VPPSIEAKETYYRGKSDLVYLNPKQDKKAKKDEECRSLQRQLKGEIEKNKTLQAPEAKLSKLN
jgi:hypothetical protein